MNMQSDNATTPAISTLQSARMMKIIDQKIPERRPIATILDCFGRSDPPQAPKVNFNFQ